MRFRIVPTINATMKERRGTPSDTHHKQICDKGKWFIGSLGAGGSANINSFMRSRVPCTTATFYARLSQLTFGASAAICVPRTLARILENAMSREVELSSANGSRNRPWFRAVQPECILPLAIRDLVQVRATRQQDLKHRSPR